MARLWAETFATRLDWAKRGHDQVIEGLSPAVREFLPKIGEGSVSVVLFGRTQVGKTSLLLTLLGIAEGDNMEKVEKVLRGKSELGHSSTATAMLYERSADEQWRLQGEVLDGAELRTRLAEIREKMLNGEIGPDPIVVSIPSRCFAPHAASLPDIRILDLPGAEAQDPAEVAHVTQIAGHYIRHADMVIIVGRREDLSFLNPSAFTLPGIRDWRYTPERFLVVTTRSYSLDSVQKWLRQEPAPGIADLQALLLKDIASHKCGLETLPGLTQRCFQLEFAESWDKLKKAEPAEIFVKAASLKAGMIAALHAQLADAAQPLNRLLRVKQAHEDVARIRRAELEVLWRIQRRKYHGVREAEKQVAQLRQSLAALRAEAQAMPDDLALAGLRQIFQTDALKAIRKTSGALIAEGQKDNTEWSTVHLKRRVTGYRDQLFRKITVALEDGFIPEAADQPDWHPSEAAVQHERLTAAFEEVNSKLQAQINEAFVPVVKHLNAYWWDSYQLETTYNADCTQIEAAKHAATEIILDFAIQICAKTVTARRAYWRRRRDNASGTIAALQSAGKNIERKRAARQKIQRDHAASMILFAEDTYQDELHARNYRAIMESVWRAEIQVRRQAVSEEMSPASRFITLLGAVAACEAKDGLAQQILQ